MQTPSEYRAWVECTVGIQKLSDRQINLGLNLAWYSNGGLSIGLPFVYRTSKSYYSDPYYSGDLKSDHLKSGLLGRISNGQALAMAMALRNTNIFVRISNVFFFLQKGTHLSGFQMVGLPDFRSHWKSRLFVTKLRFDDSKSRLFQFQIPTA